MIRQAVGELVQSSIRGERQAGLDGKTTDPTRARDRDS
jgi:hypothetical protein